MQCEKASLIVAQSGNAFVDVPGELLRVIVDVSFVSMTDQDEMKFFHRSFCCVSKSFNRAISKYLSDFIRNINENFVHLGKCDFNKLCGFAFCGVGTDLSHLDIWDMPVDGAGFVKLLKLYPNLSSLHTNCCEVNDEVLREVFKQTSLQNLELSSAYINDLTGVESLSQLESLVLANCDSLQVISSISSLKNLVVLNLAGGNKDVKAFVDFPDLSSLHKLEELCLLESDGITEHPQFLDRIQALREINPKLQIDIAPGIDAALSARLLSEQELLS